MGVRAVNHLDTWLWLFMLAPFLTGAIIGGTAAYLLRAERASRELWKADQREAHWRRTLAHHRCPQTHTPRHHAHQHQHQRAHPYQPPRQRRPARHRAVPAA